MGNDEKEVDEKLYRVVRKKGSHVNTKANPAAKQKAKKAGKDISVFFAAVKSAIEGEQPKALQIIEAEKKKANNSVQVVDNADSKQNEKESVDKVEITKAEFEQLVALTKRSAVTLVGCINLLKNSAISDMDENQKIEFEKRLKELTSEDLMTEINLLLEDKNILSAFRDGKFIIEGKRVPIERCVNNGK